MNVVDNQIISNRKNPTYWTLIVSFNKFIVLCFTKELKFTCLVVSSVSHRVTLTTLQSICQKLLENCFQKKCIYQFFTSSLRVSLQHRIDISVLVIDLTPNNNTKNSDKNKSSKCFTNSLDIFNCKLWRIIPEGHVKVPVISRQNNTLLHLKLWFIRFSDESFWFIHLPIY